MFLRSLLTEGRSRPIGPRPRYRRGNRKLALAYKASRSQFSTISDASAGCRKTPILPNEPPCPGIIPLANGHRHLWRRHRRRPGFYGKVPAFGDFLSRHMPSSFVNEWDAWLQSLIESSRLRLGQEWPDAWLEMPIWHFGLGAGIAGPGKAFGVLIPSVDRVGRHFPFSILGMDRQGRHGARRLGVTGGSLGLRRPR